MFLPIPNHGVYENRSIAVGLLPKGVAENNDVVLMDDSSASDGPPEVPIPLVVVKVGAFLVVRKDDHSTAVGVQFIVGTKVVHTQ